MITHIGLIRSCSRETEAKKKKAERRGQQCVAVWLRTLQGDATKVAQRSQQSKGSSVSLS